MFELHPRQTHLHPNGAAGSDKNARNWTGRNQDAASCTDRPAPPLPPNEASPQLR